MNGKPNIPDGEYGVIIVQNGCIVDARPNPVFDYTPAPCAPAATPCGGGESAGVQLQSGLCNLLAFDASGRLGAFLTLEQGDGIEVSGCGTAGSPLKISAKTAEAIRTYIQSANVKNISVSGTGAVSDPYVLDLGVTGVTPGNYAGFSVDEFGRITNYTQAAGGGVTSIVEGPGIKVNIESGIATISLNESGVKAGTYTFGGMEVEVDQAGRFTAIRTAIDFGGDITFDPYLTEVTINRMGSVTGVQPITRQQDGFFSAMFGGIRNTTRMQITTEVFGTFRITYHGNIKATGATSMKPGELVALPSPYSLRVDDRAVTAYARFDSSKQYITDIYAQSLAQNPGVHVIELVGADTTAQTFDDVAVLDVQIGAAG